MVEKGSSRRTKLVVGWLIAIAAVVVISTLPTPNGLTPTGQRALALLVLAAILWLGELIPVGASSLLILALAPAMGTIEVSQSFSSMGSGIIFLYIGGFIVAAAMAKYGLDRRIALWIINRVGTSVKRIALGLMIGTGVLSAWLSSVVVVLCLLPITLGILKVLEVKPGDAIGKMFLFVLAYGALLGGLATPIGTAPNALTMGFLKTMSDIEISFGEWMIIGTPLAVITLPLTWWMLVNVSFKLQDKKDAALEQYVKDEYANLGSMERGERLTIIATLIFVVLLFTEKYGKVLFGAPHWSVGTASLIASMFLFITGVLNWKEANKGIAWNVLLLFAAGLTLSKAISGTGAAEWLAQGIGSVVPGPAIPIAFSIFGAIFTQMTSNTATAAILVPIGITTANVAGIDPISVAVPMTLAIVSLGLLTPIGSALNPLVYGQMPDGNVYINKTSDYFKAGIWPFVASLPLIIVYVVYLLPLFWRH